MELARDEFVGIKEDPAQPRLVDLGHARVQHVGVALTAACALACVNETGGFCTGRIVASGGGMTEVLGAGRTGRGVGLPRATAGGVAAVCRVLGREEAGTGGLEVVHVVSADGHGHGLVARIVGVFVVVCKVHRGTDDEATGQVVGRSVENRMCCRRRPGEHLVVGLAPGQRVGGKVKGFHDETNGVNDVHGDGSCITDTGGAEALDDDRDLNGLVHENVIHHGSIGLNPLVGLDRSVTQRDGFHGEIIVGSAAPGSGLGGDNHVHGEGLHQQQHNNGEGHHSAHGHQQPRPTRLSIRRSPFDGPNRRAKNHGFSCGCKSKPRITGSSWAGLR